MCDHCSEDRDELDIRVKDTGQSNGNFSSKYGATYPLRSGHPTMEFLTWGSSYVHHYYYQIQLTVCSPEDTESNVMLYVLTRKCKYKVVPKS